MSFSKVAPQNTMTFRWQKQKIPKPIMFTSHIDTLAVEVLIRIFELRVEEARDDGSALLSLARVCKHWKDAAFHHPRLWATLHPKFLLPPGPFGSTDVQAPTERFVEYLQRWYARAGDLPLSLNVMFHPAPANAFFAYLLDFPRWCSLRLNNTEVGHDIGNWPRTLSVESRKRNHPGDPGPWPSLTVLEISASSSSCIANIPNIRSEYRVSSVRSMAPNLRDFTLDVGGSNTTAMFSNFEGFSWEGLTRFALHGIGEDRDPTFIYHILSQAQDLQTLSLKKARLQSWREVSESTPGVRIPPISDLPIVHHKLCHVVFNLGDDVLEAIVKNVRFPSVRSLQLITLAPDSLFPLLQEVCWINPSFWPELQEFSFGSAIIPRIVKKGDEDFDTFRDAPEAWWASKYSG